MPALVLRPCLLECGLLFFRGRVMMTLTDAYVFKNGIFMREDFFSDIPLLGNFDFSRFSDSDNIYVFPAFCDVHVHFREPGFSYKETIGTGSRAAAHGGYTDVLTMPNLSPVPDTVENISAEREIISRDAVIGVHPYASITYGERGNAVVDMASLAPYCAAFSDDGRGIQDEGVMREAMLRARECGKLIAAHCEDNSLLNGGYIHDGRYAREHGHKGISSESEWRQIERDLRLADETGCGYHVCHISCAESVSLIRDAKKSGVDVTCETAPHYLVLDDSMLRDEGRFKMNPPLRDKSDRLALIEGICDGTVDMIATDHAPHSAEEKSRGLSGSLMGIVGLETAFPVLYTALVRGCIIGIGRLIELMSVNPRERFGIPAGEDFCVFDLGKEYIIDSEEFLSMGKSTPFDGMKVFGENLMTVHGGKTVWVK